VFKYCLLAACSQEHLSLGDMPQIATSIRHCCDVPGPLRQLKRQTNVNQASSALTAVSAAAELDPRHSHDASWWRGLSEQGLCGNPELRRVVHVHQVPGCVVQSNCTVRKYRLQLEDHHTGLSVAVKAVDLSQNRCVLPSFS
jgi:hypothetical protein